ncbi:MAG: hypothetical protein HQM16_03420 [Deltaproteobacteria bacterium]|nr:hypothetical protein [Deltaproteobacteria bacterium]
MDNEKLVKMFQDKKFLKSNEFAATVDKIYVFLKQNKQITLTALGIFLVLVLAIPGFKWYRLKQIDAFNTKLYQAEKSLKKEALFREIIGNFKGLTASQYVRIRLINDLLDHDKKDEALKVVDEGLTQKGQNIFTTVMALKKIALLKQQGKFSEAAAEAVRLENKILPTFLNRYKMITAELYLLNKDTGKARAVFEELGEFAGVGAEAKAGLEDFDPVLANQAKDMLLFLDLGVL